MESTEELRKRHLDFEREALPHMDALYNFALRMTSDPDEADDLLQETYLKAYRFFDKFEQGTNCKAWLFRIMKNSFINIYRRTSKEPAKVDYNDVEEFYHSIRAESTDPNDLEEKIFSNILDDDVSTALEALPEEFRTVVILCDIEGFTYEEIADFVECPIGTVRSRLHRGRKMLRSQLYDYATKRGFEDKEKKRKKGNSDSAAATAAATENG
ncbi:sigma-70 family RNA polymerase sigma factor [bacterium]|nr:sigma-70 family RNA polymerase sigma factor [bacterium]